MPWMIRAAVEAAKAWSSGLVQAAPPSGVCRWFAALQLKAKRESDSVSGSPRRLREEGEHVADRDVLRNHASRRLQIVAGAALGVEDGLRRVEIAEPVRPAMVVGRAVTIHLRELQAVRRVVRRACA